MNRTRLYRRIHRGTAPTKAEVTQLNTDGRVFSYVEQGEALGDFEMVDLLTDAQDVMVTSLRQETARALGDDLLSSNAFDYSAAQLESARAAASFTVDLTGEQASSLWDILCDALVSLAVADAEVQDADTEGEVSAVTLAPVPKAIGGAAAAPPTLHMAPRFDEQATDAGIVIQPEAPPVPTDSTARHIVTGLAIGATTLAALALVVLTAVATLAVVTVAASVGAALTYAPILLQLMAMGAL